LTQIYVIFYNILLISQRILMIREAK
jgi:hypothetical protein